MPKKQKQVEMEGIDNTPLGGALATAARLGEEMEGLKKRIAAAKSEVRDEMKKVQKLKIAHSGFEFKVKITNAKEELIMTRKGKVE